MKRILLAFAVIFGVLAAPVTQAPAASVTIGENGVTIRDGRHDGYRHYRRHYRDDRRYGWRHHGRHYSRDYCRTRIVKKYRHHRLVVRKVRVCG